MSGQLLTRREVAERLQLTEHQVGQAIRRGELAEVRFGTRTSRIHPDDLEAFIRARRSAA